MTIQANSFKGLKEILISQNLIKSKGLFRLKANGVYEFKVTKAIRGK